jgi:uncharacterized spore protein YtfJ
MTKVEKDNFIKEVASNLEGMIRMNRVIGHIKNKEEEA